MDKPSLRKHHLDQRRAFGGEARTAAENTICAVLLELAAMHRGCAAYMAMRSEVSLAAFMLGLAEQKLPCALPRVEGKQLIFHRYEPGNDLEDGRHGQAEPLASAPLFTPRLILVPLLAFDRHGHRLGYGGGYYDRALADLRANGAIDLAVGVAFGFQEARALPAETHDQRLDAVVTEGGIIRF